ncbi:MAG: cbb3-type cytochrome oxidase assembly protein CcoS [Sphingobacteriales bacterium]|nr:MAG: cbb3-type cytochrome oxidase assembly protein CcoS [Sphingobacteriales bacterium]
MSALYLLVAASIAVAGTFLAAFIWSVRSNQFEDQKGASMRMLYDNDTNRVSKS